MWDKILDIWDSIKDWFSEHKWAKWILIIVALLLVYHLCMLGYYYFYYMHHPSLLK